MGDEINEDRESVIRILQECGFDDWLIKQGMYLDTPFHGKFRIKYITDPDGYYGRRTKMSDRSIPLLNVEKLLNDPDLHPSVKDVFIYNLEMFDV